MCADNKYSDIICLEGNGSRESHKGDGWTVGGAMYTLNSTEVHAVCYAIDQQGGKGGANFMKDICPTILSDSHGTPHAVCYGFDWQEERCIGGKSWYMKECAKTISTTKPGSVLVLNGQGGSALDGKYYAVDCRNGTESEVNGTLQAKTNGGISYNCNNVIRIERESPSPE